jgi:hypothetical protein
MRAQMCYHVAVIRRLLSALYVPRSFADNFEVKNQTRDGTPREYIGEPSNNDSM